MTYKGLSEQIKAILESHPMIKQVRFDPPAEWLFRASAPDFPVCCYFINSGSFERGFKNFVVSFWLLDKGGQEGEFDVDVISDQTEIAQDIITKLRQSHLRKWVVDDNISFQVVSDEYEDYLAGVRMEVTIKTNNVYDACSIPSVA